MSRVRANGEGTIGKRKSDGRWFATVPIGRDADGRVRRRTEYARTKAEAAEKLARMRSSVIDGTMVQPTRQRLAQYLDRWLRDSSRPSTSKNTYRLYESLIRIHINPRIGGVRLSNVGPQHVQALMAEMERGGASPRVRQLTLGLLRNALSRAVKWNLVARNPCLVVDRPRVPRHEARVLTQEQVRVLFDAASGDRLEALYVLAVATGLRQGELLGLQWGDIDFGRRSLTVRRQLIECGAPPELSELKTPRSRRRVDLPALAVEALSEHRRRLGALPHPVNLVFTDTLGGPIRKSNLLRRSFRPLLERAGLPRIRFHDLRHTSATLLLAAGVHPKVVQERLGHSTISLTLDTYSHAVPTMQRDAADRMDGLIG